jgi:hypothetical protein
MTIVSELSTSRNISEEEILLLAMAPLDDVISAFAASFGRCRRQENDDQKEKGVHEPVVDEINVPHHLGVEGQDHFAAMINSHWHILGPSERYLRRMVRCYVKRVEDQGVVVESDPLLELILRTTLKTDTPIPNADESGYLSFFLPPPPGEQAPKQENAEVPVTISLASDEVKSSKEEETPLRIRVYPYHNDVALRFWEAGAGLAEFLLAHSELVAGKRVMELGAGVGCTGLVLAGCSNAASVYMTDYTEVCLENMKHNIEVNTSWFRRWYCGGEPQKRLPEVFEVR